LNSRAHEPIISLIPYLNALPLTWWLSTTPDRGVRLSTDVPAEACRKLAAGEVDAGIVSSIAIPETPGLAIADGVCIASEGPVESVLLLSDKPLERIHTIALDPASRTSNVLIRILMSRWHDRSCNYVAAPTGDIEQDLESVDAVLAIGDRAFHFGAAHPSRVVLDLAEEWRHYTGLPFVFAVWGIRETSPISADLFRQARDEGLAHLDEIIAAVTMRENRDPLKREMLTRYFTSHLHYTMGSRERKSLFLFYKYAHELGLLPPIRDISFI